ncbi:hypothetical protein SERLA73DRAFT_139182 [Serpula lacrymans var. lacrymans S7.3]|uniref:Uncharacterized protein n=2 Tax=Serpula lacrymans var. lacrymans TaxID=341189 RepID=F8Q3N1_SERL3|nr:uncharacterized protein SERLADRAFT_393266 [Serpula lacrymans var. lacrymans S7.9]EGN97116.1 hypothetical protein SERLA73DRAFT_139182 [Serpula lacrymans var. lacrymans S7.3]EGO22724.1 hypothetical protein SERLADRAFT_393266 [Serpula lacrymans var. lacrymans S7.9]
MNWNSTTPRGSKDVLCVHGYDKRGRGRLLNTMQSLFIHDLTPNLSHRNLKAALTMAMTWTPMAWILTGFLSRMSWSA